MAELFTHHFIFKLGDGGKFVTAQFSFLSDGTIASLIKQTSVPLPIDFFEDFIKMSNEISRLFIKYGGVKNISIFEKGGEVAATAEIAEAVKIK